MRAMAAAILSVGAASCGGGSAPTHENGESFRLASTAFQDGQPIPARFTCDGANQSPPLAWDELPEGTRSLALIVEDPDAPNGPFRHWGMYDIPPGNRSLAAGQSVGRQAMNDFAKATYGGPCPPRGTPIHHYHLKLIALGVERLNLGARPKVADVQDEASKHALGYGELIGTYKRK